MEKTDKEYLKEKRKFIAKMIPAKALENFGIENFKGSLETVYFIKNDKEKYLTTGAYLNSKTDTWQVYERDNREETLKSDKSAMVYYPSVADYIGMREKILVNEVYDKLENVYSIPAKDDIDKSLLKASKYNSQLSNKYNSRVKQEFKELDKNDLLKAIDLGIDKLPKENLKRIEVDYKLSTGVIKKISGIAFVSKPFVDKNGNEKLNDNLVGHLFLDEPLVFKSEKKGDFTMDSVLLNKNSGNYIMSNNFDKNNKLVIVNDIKNFSKESLKLNTTVCYLNNLNKSRNLENFIEKNKSKFKEISFVKSNDTLTQAKFISKIANINYDIQKVKEKALDKPKTKTRSKSKSKEI